MIRVPARRGLGILLDEKTGGTPGERGEGIRGDVLESLGRDLEGVHA
jgi:hypothetical protein